MGPRRIRASGDPVTVDDAPAVATRRYAAAYDHHSDEEQRLVGLGRYAEAEGAHQYAMWCLRAYNAEVGDWQAQGGDRGR